LFSTSILNGQEAAEAQRRAAEEQKALFEMIVQRARRQNQVQGAQPRPVARPIDRVTIGKYTLGTRCSPIDDRLRGHLQLDESIGLAIDEVSPESPASAAELEKDDILLFADDQAIATKEELAQVVEFAGEEERSLTLTFIRDGEERSTEITPVKRSASVNPGDALEINPDLDPHRLLPLQPDLPDFDPEEMKRQIEQR